MSDEFWVRAQDAETIFKDLGEWIEVPIGGLVLVAVTAISARSSPPRDRRTMLGPGFALAFNSEREREKYPYAWRGADAPTILWGEPLKRADGAEAYVSTRWVDECVALGFVWKADVTADHRWAAVNPY